MQFSAWSSPTACWAAMQSSSVVHQPLPVTWQWKKELNPRPSGACMHCHHSNSLGTQTLTGTGLLPSGRMDMQLPAHLGIASFFGWRYMSHFSSWWRVSPALLLSSLQLTAISFHTKIHSPGLTHLASAKTPSSRIVNKLSFRPSCSQAPCSCLDNCHHYWWDGKENCEKKNKAPWVDVRRV